MLIESIFERKASYLVATLAGAVWLLLSGVPTGIVETPFYARMTPVEWWNYPFWIANSLLVALIAATYTPGRAGSPSPADVRDGSPLSGGLGGLLTVFAIGCPVCNKLVVLLLGFGGAMTYFAPVQPLLGFLSTALLAYGLRHRLTRRSSCPATPAT